jgi:DNA polymerase III subunit epsilon
MTQFTHEIIRMERGETKGSKSPMWRCQTKDGQKVNVFQHSDPARDNTVMFREAGYFGYMEALKVGEAVEWSQSPIWAVLEKDGDWWKVTDVCKKVHDAEPDVLWQPNLELYRHRAVYQANQIIHHAVRIFDVETTGLRTDDELIAISIFDENSDVMLDTFIRPAHPEKLLRVQKGGTNAAQITGITPEMLEHTRSFYDTWPDIHGALDGSIWCAYNASFDVGVLDRECSNAGCPLLTNRGVFDAAQIAAEYLGNWNAKRQWFEMMKLGEVAARLGVMIDVQHNAGADVKTTLAMLKAIANDVFVDPF